MNCGNDSNCVHWLYAVLTGTWTSTDSVIVLTFLVSFGSGSTDPYPRPAFLPLGEPSEPAEQLLGETERDVAVTGAGVDRERRRGQPCVQPLAVGRRDHRVRLAVGEEHRSSDVGEVEVPRAQPGQVVAHV